MSQSESLKPCPFCGGEPERLELTDEDNFGGSVISCKKCGASSPVHFDRKENLDDSWNRRPSTADRGGEVEVRALEWREPDADDIQDCDDCLWMATGMGGRYAISTRQLVSIQSPDKMGYLLWDADDAFSFTEHLTIEAAKAAAQADFTARIRSALVTTAGEAILRSYDDEGRAINPPAALVTDKG